MMDDLDLYLLPPMAFARVGSADETSPNFFHGERAINGYSQIPLHPSDRYEVEPGGTLKNAGKTKEITPDSFTTSITNEYGEEKKLVKPVAPFFEVWRKVEDSDGIEQLHRFTWEELIKLIDDKRYSFHWEVEVANKKIYRRTNEKSHIFELSGSGVIPAASQERHPYIQVKLGTHTLVPLEANCEAMESSSNSISFGAVQFIKKSTDNDVVMLRFTPAKGRVYGKNGDGYELELKKKNKAQWKGHSDTGLESTLPPGIYAKTKGRNGDSQGYYDDVCDGFVRFIVTDKSGNFVDSATARIITTPPDYSPDTLPIRSVDDELEQLIYGISAKKQYQNTDKGREEILQKLINILERALDGISNSSYRRIFDRLKLKAGAGANIAFPYADTDDNKHLINVHSLLIDKLKNISNEASNESAIIITEILNRIRKFDETASNKPQNLRKMPALMRGADGGRLALTRRQHHLFIWAVTLFKESDFNQEYKKYLENHVDNTLRLANRIIKDNVKEKFTKRIQELIDQIQRSSDLSEQQSISKSLEFQLHLIIYKLFTQTEDLTTFKELGSETNPPSRPTTESIIVDSMYLVNQFRFLSKYNPPSILPEFAVSNCYPGLEIDFRGIWRHIFKGKQLHESKPYFLEDGKVKDKDKNTFKSISDTNNNERGSVLATDSKFSSLEYFNSLAKHLTPVPVNDEANTIVRINDYEKVTAEKIFSKGALINEAIASAGELTQGLCSPWQNDFKDCECDYWAASRPDFVTMEIENTSGKKEIRKQPWMGDDFEVEAYDDLFTDWETELKFIIKGKNFVSKKTGGEHDL